ncbi:glycoside hydrolase family 92 protein [Stereum hirsutum FP-91666 SS1]|uniref:glycoside hydrolase family 92 protein n=1 Tax=Stereum hirsutum (strain FP-91666) TaxID=721885 RepID=UPI000440C009|nr:glycoside hydrolase family 92 protein [Stereum hirsutum FP-91666 SS1]EIM87038.1 glycoside hydrolase family 92 protein [Stereum hirsutum FP-91666 SS1]
MLSSPLLLTVLLLGSSTAVTAQNSSDGDPASFVNLFIGTTNGGHVFPGVTLPHGMIKVGMDTNSPGNHAGYDRDPQFNVTGFSQLHDDGTGGSVPLSNFKVFALPDCTSFEECATSIESRPVPRKVLDSGLPDDSATPGYFSTNLTNGVRVELTATRRASLQRHTFSPTANSTVPRIAFDLTNDGQQSSTDPELTLDPTTLRVVGGSHFSASFGPGRYHIFACADFRTLDTEGNIVLTEPLEYGTWLGNQPIQFTTNIQQQYFGFTSEAGTLFTLPSNTTSVLVRTGVSFISSDQACSNAESEIPDFDFEATQAAARSAWNEVLGNVNVELFNGTVAGSGNGTVDAVDAGSDQEDMRVLLYSSLYRTHISPADYTGENPRWNSTEPYYDSFYCNWDTYRTLYPLMAMHDPVRFSLIVRGLINIQQHEGWLPECRGATDMHFIQGGSDADPILGEFFVKFASQASSLGVDPDGLYNALLADAENLPPNWDVQGRQVDAWIEYGYLPQDLFEAGGTNSKQVSRALEYAFGDFAISQVAKLMNKSDDATKYVGRAGNFVNVWNPNTTVGGSVKNDVLGMMQPRFLNGTFNFTDPRHCSVNDPLQSTCFLNAANHDGFYEGSPLLYSQYVPQDNAKLIELQGGNESFVDRLNFIIDNGYFDVTDEPGQQIPFMYHYVSKPGRSTQRSRETIATFFNTTDVGLPGNDDSGAMGSYAFFYLAGLYPLPATRQILLSSPFFPSISFTNPVFNTTTTIKAVNFQGNPSNGTGGTVFVKNVTIDGTPWKSNCFLEWNVFEKGSTVELTLTDDIDVACGDTPDTLPPSLSTGGYDTV